MHDTTYDQRTCVCVCMRERQVDSFMILKKVSHVKSHTEFTSSAQAAHRLPTIQAPTQRSRRQKGDTKPGPYRGPTEIRRQRITFSDRGGVARLWCTPVPLYVTHRHAFVGIKKLQNQHTKTLRTAVTPQGCVPPRSTQCFGQEFCVGISEGAHWKHEGHCELQRRQCIALSHFTAQKSRGFLEHLRIPPHGRQVPRVLSCSTFSASVCYSPNKLTSLTISTVATLQQMLLIAQLQVTVRRPSGDVSSPPQPSLEI